MRVKYQLFHAVGWFCTCFWRVRVRVRTGDSDRPGRAPGALGAGAEGAACASRSEAPAELGPAQLAWPVPPACARARATPRGRAQPLGVPPSPLIGRRTQQSQL